MYYHCSLSTEFFGVVLIKPFLFLFSFQKDNHNNPSVLVLNINKFMENHLHISCSRDNGSKLQLVTAHAF